MSIESTLHDELSSLYNECNNLIDELENNYARKLISMDYINSENNEKTDILELLKQIASQLEIHLKLDDTTITTVDFYSNFQSQFDMGRYQKGVDYYIQDGYDGTETLVTDLGTLKREFAINNCMNSMNLVPINIASNAMKYMPSGQHVKVVLLKTPKRNIVTITNLGPKNKEENLERLTEEGYRGINSSDMAGMGLGLAQIKSVIGLHKKLIDASIDIAQEDAVVKIGEDEYSWFSITITYLRSVSEQTIKPATEEFTKRIPLIIAHNMVDILANLFVVVDRLPKLRFKEFDKTIKHKYDSIINKFQLDVERMAATIKLCLYVRNNYSTNNLLGNICSITIGSFFKRAIEQLFIHKYIDKSKPNITGGSQKKIDTYSAVYPALFVLCELILESSDNDTELDVDIDDSGITITNESLDFSTILYNDELQEPELEQTNHIKSCMCIDLLQDCEIKFEINNNNIIINYQNGIIK